MHPKRGTEPNRNKDQEKLEQQGQRPCDIVNDLVIQNISIRIIVSAG
jgi:hypothetical protein